jgi:hypothetical protein
MHQRVGDAKTALSLQLRGRAEGTQHHFPVSVFSVATEKLTIPREGKGWGNQAISKI